jgi:hypothetical protein
MAIRFEKCWVEQCRATEGIRESFGLDKALGYLIGEKLINFVRAADDRPEFAAELPNFVAAIRRIFTPEEIAAYLTTVRRVGAVGHVCTDEEYEVMRDRGMFLEDPVGGAEDVLILERIKEMLT